MYRYYVKMKKGRTTIYGECYSKNLILDYIEQQKVLGFEVVETNFPYDGLKVRYTK